jgi:dinuclear metal center YbgI/SA1388 family protein
MRALGAPAVGDIVTNVAQVVAAIERRYDPAWAQGWDSIGLICGDPDAPVSRVLIAVDPVEVVVEEAIASGAQLLFVHHPLFLGGTESVAATTAKGRLVRRLITANVALYVAHTNADVARPGVSDALAEALGLRDVRSLDPASERGLGRIGELAAATSLGEFLASAAAALPAKVWGLRATGDLDRVVRVIAVAGGACAEIAGPAADLGADVLVTADLKHHRTSEAVADYDIALVDVAHWATEQPWVVAAARLLHSDLVAAGTNVEFIASTTVTDPWTLHHH